MAVFLHGPAVTPSLGTRPREPVWSGPARRDAGKGAVGGLRFLLGRLGHVVGLGRASGQGASILTGPAARASCNPLGTPGAPPHRAGSRCRARLVLATSAIRRAYATGQVPGRGVTGRHPRAGPISSPSAASDSPPRTQGRCLTPRRCTAPVPPAQCPPGSTPGWPTRTPLAGGSLPPTRPSAPRRHPRPRAQSTRSSCSPGT